VQPLLSGSQFCWVHPVGAHSNIDLGLHKDHLVQLLGALSNPSWEARRLLDMADSWARKAKTQPTQRR
jgi:hypothetical protein